VSQTNYTLTDFAEHHPDFSHDAVKWYLEEGKLIMGVVRENVHAVTKGISSRIGFHHLSTQIQLV
jgi:hypothetical protein